ncbi:MAG: hypothetical protein IRZ04_19410 [Rhodospirillales bacterium]|nr:hypothetical protein [Rhodospirillales bacterium]
MNGEAAREGGSTTAGAPRAYHVERPDGGLAALLVEVERQARNRAGDLVAARRLPRDFVALYSPTVREERESRRLLAAACAARCAAAFVALARGRAVPGSLVDRRFVLGGGRV